MADSVKQLVDDCVEKKLARNKADAEYKASCKRLIDLGVQHADDWTPTELGGNTWTAAGTVHTAAVIYPRASLKELFNAAAKSFVKIRLLCGEAFDALFKPAVAFEPRHNFRALALERLPKRTAGTLIKLCEGDAKPRVTLKIGTSEEESE
jgi:hypothetical protein